MNLEKLKSHIINSCDHAQDVNELRADTIINFVKDMSDKGFSPYDIAVSMMNAAPDVILVSEPNEELYYFGEYMREVGAMAMRCAEAKEKSINNVQETDQPDHII